MIFRFFFLLLTALLIMDVTATSAHSGKPGGEVSFKVTIEAPEDNTDTKLWLPYPVSDEYQAISDIRIEGNQSFDGIYKDPSTGNMALYAEWTTPQKKLRRLDFSFKVSSIGERVGNLSGENYASAIPEEVSGYLEGTNFIPVEGVVKEISDKIVTSEDTITERARAVYDWVVENTYRDPEIQGCGTGDVEVLLTRKAGGKCADISSVFVAIARASGVPAREVFGLRLGLGGLGISDITKGHHCWAEFYRPGSGWVPVDPADVRKAVLVNNLKIEDAGAFREYYFGTVDKMRVVLGRGGRGVSLAPKLRDGPLNYFMYPYAEVDGKALPWLAAQEGLKYSVSFKGLN